MRFFLCGSWMVLGVSMTIGAPKEGEKSSLAAIESPSTRRSPDRLWMAAANKDGTKIDLWDLEKRAVSKQFTAPKDDRFTAMAFDPGGKLLTVGTEAGAIYGWSLATAAEAWKLQSTEKTPIAALVVSPDGKRLVSIQKDKGGVVHWDPATRSATAMGSGVHWLLSSFSKDGKYAFSVARNEAWQLEQGRDKAEKVWTGENQAIAKAVVNPDGNVVAVLHAKGLELWSLSPFAKYEPLEYPESAVPFFTGDGKSLAVIRMKDKDRGVLDLWDISEGRAQVAFRRTIEGLISPDVATTQDRSLSAFIGERSEFVRLARLDQKIVTDVGKDYRFSNSSPNSVQRVALSPDGKYMATRHEGGMIRLWDLNGKQVVVERKQDRLGARFDPEIVPAPIVIATIPGPVKSTHLEFTGKNSTLALQTSADRKLLLDISRYLKAGTPWVVTFKFSHGGAPSRMLDFSPDAKKLAVVPSSFGRVFLLNPLENKIEGSLPGSPFLIRFNAAGTRLMLLSTSRMDHYETADGRMSEVKEYRKAVEESWEERLTDGLVFEKKLRIVDPDRMAFVASVKPESVSDFGQRALSQDGKRYAFLGSKKVGGGYGLDVIDMRKSETIASMPLNIDSYYAVRFLSDPGRVVVATSDTLVAVNYGRRQSSIVWPKEKDRKLDKKPTRPSGVAGSVTGAAADDLAFGPDRTTRWMGIRAMDVSRSDVAAVATVEGNVYLVDLLKGETILHYTIPDQSPQVVRFSDDGKQLAIVQENGRITLLKCAAWLPKRLPPK